MEIHPKIQEYLSTIDLSSSDHRMAYNLEAKIAYWFHMFMDHELLNFGMVLTGYVFRQQEVQTLLIVKATRGDIRQVVFVSGQTPIGCMRVFCRKLYAETLAWKRDKYV